MPTLSQLITERIDRLDSIPDALFSGIINDDKSKLEEISNDLIDAINDSISMENKLPEVNLNLETKQVQPKIRLNRAYYEDMSHDDREAIMNNILDSKKYEELTYEETEILKLIGEINSKNKG